MGFFLEEEMCRGSSESREQESGGGPCEGLGLAGCLDLGAEGRREGVLGQLPSGALAGYPGC